MATRQSRAGSAKERGTLHALLDEHGRTYAAEAGITVRDTPQPLYQLVVLSGLLSARIRSSMATGAARALFGDGMNTPRRMADATWQRRVDALGRGGYRRFDERTAAQLGEGAELLLDRYRGDLRRMRDAARDEADLRARLREIPGMGPAGVDIFLREAQAVWPELAPHLDRKAMDGAKRLGLPDGPREMAKLGEAVDADPAVLAAALVRAALDRKVADQALREGKEKTSAR